MSYDSLESVLERLQPGWQGHYLASVTSTQDVARTAALRGAPSRSVFVADVQTAGRGRQGRTWLARPGSGLLLSILWRETQRTPRPWRWTARASVALVEAIEHTVPGLRPAIKWPNDVLLDDRKVAGILAESSWDGQRLMVIVGVGVNVNMAQQELAEASTSATSLQVAAGRPIDRGQLLLVFLERLDEHAERSDTDVLARWQRRLWGRGQRLRLVDVDGELEVVVLGADTDGSLRVRLPDGTERTTTTGELIL